MRNLTFVTELAGLRIAALACRGCSQTKLGVTITG